ncbi:unnamed protein product [Protopolystoma xenopodis]|uniref:Uncharacterized protein n=1 Tax=Protopolystoma xenopodis TaxID=117903 RepID=A0A3S5AR30_9PLAT|nr:unnamed protein product [Protopolystoma xenopodis]
MKRFEGHFHQKTTANSSLPAVDWLYCNIHADAVSEAVSFDSGENVLSFWLSNDEHHQSKSQSTTGQEESAVVFWWKRPSNLFIQHLHSKWNTSVKPFNERVHDADCVKSADERMERVGSWQSSLFAMHDAMKFRPKVEHLLYTAAWTADHPPTGRLSTNPTRRQQSDWG